MECIEIYIVEKVWRLLRIAATTVIIAAGYVIIAAASVNTE